MLTLILKRLHAAKSLKELVLATTQLSQDDAIEALASESGVACFRGAEIDVLDRYYHTACEFQATDIVRLTADNPFVDGEFVDWTVEQYVSSDPSCDYASTALSHTFPVGLSVEVFSFETLARAWREDNQMEWREHVTPYIYRHPELFRVLSLNSPSDYSSMRWTVDTPEDLTFVRMIYQQFQNDQFSWQDVLRLLSDNPELCRINADMHS